MTKIMPQEIEVWYLLPALRREIARIFVKDFKTTQKEVAKIFGITEAAVSQYMKSKRATKLKFNKQELEKIKKTTSMIFKNKDNFAAYIYDLCAKLRGTKTLCNLHKKIDKTVPKNCSICK
ncbi:hypothetical protein HQ529_01790 [Candidatus Woesearchaeota archaeon]|nr:hypothetical protein [Candidatus Woesearchaeota archaeon]